MYEPIFRKVRCPRCGHRFSQLIEFGKSFKQDDLIDLIKRYERYESDIKKLIRMVETAEDRAINELDLWHIFSFLYNEPGGIFKFLKALEIYWNKRYYKQGKGLKYFLAMAANIRLEDYNDTNPIHKENTRGVGKEH